MGYAVPLPGDNPDKSAQVWTIPCLLVIAMRRMSTSLKHCGVWPTCPQAEAKAIMQRTADLFTNYHDRLRKVMRGLAPALSSLRSKQQKRNPTLLDPT